MGREDISMLSSSSYTPTDLSRKTEPTTLSVPPDGQAITINTHRGRSEDSNGNPLNAPSPASLLIEYYEGKRSDGGPLSRPTVRVKLTSSSKGRSQLKSRDPTEVSTRESDRTRRASYSNRTSSMLPKNEDRLTLGEDRIDENGRSRSFSGNVSSNLSLEDDDSRYNDATDITIRTKARRPSSKKEYRDSYGQDTLSPNAARKARSRSASREHDDNLKPKLGKRRSRSLERESQAVKEGPEKRGISGKSKSKNADDNTNLKAPRRRRSRSTSRDRTKKGDKMSERIISKLTDHQQYSPALLEAVEESIRKLILPQLHELKASQNKSKFDQTLAAITAKIQPQLAVADDSRGIKSASMPDVSKPTLVLQSDFDKGKGQAFVLSSSRDRSPGKEDENYVVNGVEDNSLKSDTSYTRAPGLGPTYTADGRSIHSLHSDRGEGVPLEQPKDVAPEQRLSMPLMPRDYAESTSGETRNSIRTEQDHLPYPEETMIPTRGNTPHLSRTASFDTLDTVGGRKIIREPESELAPSTLYPDDHEDSTSSIDSASRVSLHSIQHAHIAQAKPIVVNSPSQLSFPSMSDTPSTKIARQQRKGKARDALIGDADRHDDKEDKEDKGYALTDLSNNEAAPPAKNCADWFAEERELAQQKALLDPNLQRATIEVRHMSAHNERSFEDMQSEKVRPGQEVYGISAYNPSLVSTPFAIESNVASIRDGMSNLSFQTLPALSGNSPYPDLHDPMPDITGIPAGDDEITNPSVIQGSMSHQHWDDTNIGDSKQSQMKDEGYASPGFSSPGPSAHPMGGIDDIMESDEYNSQNRGRHSRVGSGGSHGMPDQLYDSATGRGVERIHSKDIIALMDHLTVRDAQRNARDTEILITLVRSAAEIRNAHEDFKKLLEQAKNEIIHQVDQNTEKTVRNALIGPRPQPITAPRARRSITEGPGHDDDVQKRKSTGIFKKALKGLSMKSEKDLTRIEEMLVRLLEEVEGLRDEKSLVYQQGILGAIERVKNTPRLDPPSSSAANSGYYTGTVPSAGGSAGPSRQASGIKVYDEMKNHTNHRISPIEENGPASVQARSLPLENSLPQISAPPTASHIASSGTTPTKATERGGMKRESNTSSIFPKISRWSETTTSSGVRGFLRKGKAGKESEASQSNSEFDFWAESGHPGHQPDQFATTPRGEDLQSPALPPSSRGTDVPVNQATIRSSLEVKHPQPKMVYRHQLEQKAQQLLNMDPVVNQSNPSLVLSLNEKDQNFPVSPISDGYTNSMADSSLPPQRPPKILEEYEGTPSPVSGPLKEKKSKERNKDRGHRKEREKDRDAESKDKETRRRERQERREKRERREREKENGGERSHRSSRTKLKEVPGEYIEADYGGSELDQTPSTATRSISNVSKVKGPRPPSSHSHKERSSERRERREREKEERRSSGEGIGGDGAGLETSGTVIKRQRVKSYRAEAGEFFN